MQVKFDIEKSKRKALAQKIAELMGAEVKYLGVPSCAFQIGTFTLSKDSVLDCGDVDVDSLLDELEKMGFPLVAEPEKLTVTMPRDFFTETTLANLLQIRENKHTLFKHAFQTETLAIYECEETIEFPWFTIEKDGDSDAYIHFISALCHFAKGLNHVNKKPDTSENEKYAFRCFLLRLGFVGAEYKADRKILLRNLSGCSAFKKGRKAGENDAVSE